MRNFLRSSPAGTTFFMLSLVLLLSFIWSVYDEALVRRPWKSYQEDFFKLELEKLKKEIGDEKKSENAQEIKELEANLEKLNGEFKEKQESDQYKELIKKFDKAKIKLSEVSLDIQFAKNKASELYYQYQHAVEKGYDYSKEKAAWEKRIEIINSLEPKLEKIRQGRDESLKEISGYKKEITYVQKEIEKRMHAISKIEEKIELVSNKSPEINQIVIEDFDKNNFKEPVLKVDRCISCHLTVTRKGFEDFPEPFKTHSNLEILKKHPIEKFGCTTCHGGQGTGLTFFDAGHTPKNTNQKEKWIDEYSWHPISHWARPMLAGDYIQSSCRDCHLHEEDIESAPVLSEGINLFRETLGCANCHLVKGYEDMNKIGPDLKNIGAKVNSSWMFRWVKNPQNHHKRSRMPNFKLSDDEVLSAISYLKSFEKDMSWKKQVLSSGVLKNRALIDKGKQLLKVKGCNGCHSTSDLTVYENTTRDIAPTLVNVGNKTTPDWLYNWILEPTGYLHSSKMPNFRLTTQEAEAIVAYLLSSSDKNYKTIQGLDEKIESMIGKEEEIKKGFKVITGYGCYGCHNIPGTEELERVGAELTTFGKKEVYELAFGYANDVERSWLGYTKAKLKTPRIFETEIVAQKMPVFNISEQEAHALTVFLKSLRDDDIPKNFTKFVSPNYIQIQKGRKLIKKYNCIGCHEIEKGWGGGNIQLALSDIHRDEIKAKSYGPPALIGEGKKVQPEWLAHFIFNPTNIRPWIQTTMPTFNFSNAEVNDVIKYFLAVSNQDLIFHYWKTVNLTQTQKDEMDLLFKQLKCANCHSFGKGGQVSSASELAPDLTMARHRLNPNWVREWLINPQELQPGTKMPNFFIEIDEDDGEVMELLPEPMKKIEHLVNYLFN